jgi:DNA primase
MELHFQYDIETIVSNLKKYLPDYLTEKGYDISKNFKCFNPDHQDDTPSCSLLLKDPNKPRCFCFGCNAAYDIFDAVYLFENKPKSGPEWFEQTLKYLCDKYKVELTFKDLTEEQLYELNTYRAYAVASDLIKKNNFNPNNNTHKPIIA